MRFFSTTLVLVAISGLALAGHLHHGHHHEFESGGKHSEEISYSVATTHEQTGHGGGGHDSVHEWSSDSGHDDGGDDWSHFSGHNVGGDDAGHYEHHDEGHDHFAHPKYEFDYGVKDTKTGDIKGHSESRDGDKVKGSYTLKEADGTTRHVEYSSDKKKGFTATVHKFGHANADHGSSHGHGDHGSSHGHEHGHASSYVVVKKHEEKKH